MRTKHLRIMVAALATIVALANTSVRANNIQVANTTLVNNGTTAQVQFDLSWENSWRGVGMPNWDAAWVFVKYRTISGGNFWAPVHLNGTGHVAPGGAQIDLGLDNPGAPYNAGGNRARGAFIYRSTDGSGTINGSVQLQWDYTAGGLTFSQIAQVQVFAIEMVYVPQAAFAAGSVGAETNRFNLTTINTGSASQAPSGTGSLGGQAGGYPSGQTAPVAIWPNGFNAFYSMKYEVSQQGYVDFLNTLTYTQQVTRTTNVPNSPVGTGALITGNVNRNGIDIRTPGSNPTIPAVYACNLNGNATFGEATDGKDIACNYLSWGDLTAYLDWSGLRPMTELEFEKACRGTVAPVANEFPWGTTGLAFLPYSLSAVGTPGEQISGGYNIQGNAAYQNTIPAGAASGPLRAGIFANNVSNFGRVAAGASFYGVMELGGNLWERTVTIGNVNGRAYTGTHGNGIYSGVEADVPAWPTPTADGAGFRGGTWTQAASTLRVSDRLAAFNSVPTRSNDHGGRGVRTAP